MKNLALVGFIALTLAGCQTVAERRAEIDAGDDARCQQFGARRGTPAYQQCRLDLERNRAIASQPRQTVVVGGGPVFGGPIYGPRPYYGGPGFCRPTPWGVRCY